MRLVKPAALMAIAAAVALTAGPATAQSREQRDRDARGGQTRGQARERGSTQRGTAGHEQRQEEGRHDRAVPRPEDYRSRAYAEPRAYGYARPQVRIPVVRYGRQYYAFRPRYRIGLGIFLGFPVPYPVTYGYPAYVYGYPYPYPADEYPAEVPPPNGSVMTQPPAQGTFGGVSFDITPDDASVSVDGAYVGVVRDFSPVDQPLTLTPGRHHIELQAPGMIPLAFDVDIQPGQVLPYRGALQPQ